MKSLIFICLNVLLISNAVCFAESKNDDRQREIEKTLFIAAGVQEITLKIGLVDCIAYALKNNSEIKIESMEPKLKENDVKIARADFEPAAAFDYNLRDNTKLSSSSLSGANVSKYRDMDFSAGVSGKLITGTEYNFEFINEKYGSNSSYQPINPYYSTEPVITLTQPLFRGFGAVVNNADISIARNNQAQSQESFKNTVIDTISAAKSAYYTYMYYLENYAIAQTAFSRAENLFEINKARYDKGLLSSVDLLESETAVAQGQKVLIAAESNLKKSEDDLKLVTNLVDDPQGWNAKIELIDLQPVFKEEKLNLLESLKNAFSNRPDYSSAKFDLKNRDIKIVTAKNSLLPTIDLITSFGINGLGKDYTGALKKADIDYKDWSVGFKVSVPWGGSERAKLEQRKLEKAQALLALRRLEQNIILEVRDKIRGVDIQSRQVKTAKIARETEEKNYEAQKQRYSAGEVSTHDIVDYQEKLAQAELDYVKALIDYNIALINLDKSEGITLAKNNVKLEEK